MKTVIHWPQFILMIVLTMTPSAIMGLVVDNVLLGFSLGMLFGTTIPPIYMAFIDVWHFEDERGRRI